jgi:hypothetical protein
VPFRADPNLSGVLSYLGSPIAMIEPSALRDQLHAELPLQCVQGAEGVAIRTSEERFLLPEGEELKALHVLCLEPGTFPRRMGQIAALLLDVTQGWRSLAAAQAVLESEASTANAPPEYCAQLVEVQRPYVYAAGQGESDPEWRYERTETMDLVGSHELALIVEAHRSVPAFAEISVSATVRAGLHSTDVDWQPQPGIARVELPVS